MSGFLATNGHGPLARANGGGYVDLRGREPDEGGLELFDLQLLNQRQGRDPLPFPFMLTRPSRFEYAEQVEAHAAELPERINGGDLTQFARCLNALNQADVTVTGHVQYVPADTPSIRLLAFRAGQAGYVMQQRPDEDVLDVAAVSPFELGARVAAAIGLVEPGQHPTVLNGEHVPTDELASEDDGFVVRHEVRTAHGETVFANQVSAYGTVQSTWRPAKAWGIEQGKAALIWVRVTDDGDYLGAPDRSHGTPVTAALLAERIDDMIANDLESLREFRGD